MSTHTIKKIDKPRTLYAHPFSKAYWVDAAMELKDTKTLVIAALMIALRVSMKWTVIPLAPNLNINIGAPLVNAMGAMIFGPVVAGLAACVSDFLGYLLFPQGGTYFLPYMFIEVAGSMLFAMFFYRAKITVTRIIWARFSMDMIVNVFLNSIASMMYYQMVLGKSYTFMLLPAIIKNLCMFPIESFLLTLFLGVVIPMCYRMKLIYWTPDENSSLKFDKKHFGLLLLLFSIGVSAVVGYLFYHYSTNSISGEYTAQERYEANCQITEVFLADELGAPYADKVLVSTVQSAYKEFMGDETRYEVVIYEVDEAALAAYDTDLETIRGMSRSKANAVAGDGVMSKIYSGSVTILNETGEATAMELVP